MKSKKIFKLLCPAAGILSFMISTGVCSMPVYAADSNTAVVADVENENAPAGALKINKSVEVNGVKITVLDAIAIKNEVKTRIKFETEKTIDDATFNNSFVQQTYGDDDYNGYNGDYDILDDHTFMYTTDNESDDYEYAQKGILRIDVVIPKLDINTCIKVPVDFGDQFKNVKEISINKQLNDFDDMKIEKIQKSAFGTDIYYKAKDKDTHFSYSGERSFWIKNGDKFYKTYDHGMTSFEDDYQTGYYRCSALNSSVVSTDESVSLIPIQFDVNEEDLDNIYDNYEEEENKSTENGIAYTKNFKFNDNTVGEIYKVEKKDNKIKIYCKGDTEDEGLIMINNLYVHYKYDENSNEQNNYYDFEENTCMYKDTNEQNGYVLECNNIDTSKDIEISIDRAAAYNSKYIVGKEIELK